jgi:hypothetical protein
MQSPLNVRCLTILSNTERNITSVVWSICSHSLFVVLMGWGGGLSKSIPVNQISLSCTNENQDIQTWVYFGHRNPQSVFYWSPLVPYDG